jgi:hypothetical protein
MKADEWDSCVRDLVAATTVPELGPECPRCGYRVCVHNCTDEQKLIICRNSSCSYERDLTGKEGTIEELLWPEKYR